MTRLCIFLGNQGREYSDNRHNAAWIFLDSLNLTGGLNWKKGFKGQWANHNSMFLLKPETYMNRSGESVVEIMNFYKIGMDEILVIHDELELPFGFLSIKDGGGLGGHNGLRSIKEKLGSADFFRLRIGIGRPPHDNVSAWVLSDFSDEERQLLEDRVFPQAGKLFSSFLDDPAQALKDYAKLKVLD